MADSIKKYTPQQAKQKIYRYCAYQERSHKEVRDKLYSYGLRTSDVEEILTELITDGFLSEERFARAYAGGKFRMKGWGRIKIQRALEAKGVSTYCIKSGLKEIEKNEYEEKLESLLEKRCSQLEETNVFSQRDKLATFAIQKGYEPDLVWTKVKALLPDK